MDARRGSICDAPARVVVPRHGTWEEGGMEGGATARQCHVVLQVDEEVTACPSAAASVPSIARAR